MAKGIVERWRLMSKEESAIIAEQLTNKSALASAFEAKPYYKHFTLYFISIILVSIINKPSAADPKSANQTALLRPL